MRRLLLCLCLLVMILLVVSVPSRLADAFGLRVAVHGQAVAADAPAQAVAAFYTALDVKDFATAYGLLSGRFRAGHPFSPWREGYATTAAVGFDVSPTDDPATVAVYLTAIDNNDDFTQRVTRFAGVWYLVPDGSGGWLLDTPSISVADEPAAYAAPAYDFSAFAEGWSHHGFGLGVDAYGNGTAVWRIYQWCSDDPTPPCDTIAGNEIIDGGRGIIAFDHVFGSSAVGTVTGTTDSTSLRPYATATLTLLPFDMAVLVQPGSVIVLCGSASTRNRPRVVQNLCGA